MTLTDPFQTLAVRVAGMVGMPAETAGRLYRFCVTGAVVTGVYVAAAWFSVQRLHVTVTAGAVIAFVVSGLVSYVGNTLWGFGAEVSGRTLRRFVLVTLTSFCLNGVLAWTLERLGVNHLAISLVTVAVVASFNFVGHSVYTYRAEG